MKTDALLKLNIHITGKEVVLLSELASDFVRKADMEKKPVDSSKYEFCKEIISSINNSLNELDLEVQDA